MQKRKEPLQDPGEVTTEAGTVLLRISLGYNQTPLIELYED